LEYRMEYICGGTAGIIFVGECFQFNERNSFHKPCGAKITVD
jgi:hypothetical protein